MTKRKPPGVPWESWTDRQIRVQPNKTRLPDAHALVLRTQHDCVCLQSRFEIAWEPDRRFAVSFESDDGSASFVDSSSSKSGETRRLHSWMSSCRNLSGPTSR